MTIGRLRRVALQPICALFAVAFPLVATAADSAKTRSTKSASSLEKTKKSVKTTGSIGAAAKAKVAAQSVPQATLGGDVTHTRFLIGLPKDVEYRVFSLSNPNRVIVDIAETTLQLPPQPEENIAVGLVRSFHAGRSGPGKSRVVIEVIRPVVVDGAHILPSEDGKGHRLALDIVPVNPATGAAKKPLKTASLSSLGAFDVQPPLPMPALRPEEMAARAFKPIIVIDPGHGGHDSGAMKNGIVEKDVVLAFSKVLKEKLEKTGRYKVLMTRDKDVFVELDKRKDYAEQHKANLFIAVHADYAGKNSKARGATIYSLRESVANALQRSAKGQASSAVLTKAEVETMKEASLGTDISAVKSILADLAGREVEVTQERTNVFTRSVIEYMGASTELRAKPDQQAAFRVLKTAQFPSVLIELAYVTNKQDAALLQSDSWRDKVSDSIMTAVENYFGNQIARLPM
ncbi:N-acetylmuramoyl-L-alanine amidase [Hyphomicrobium sp.]|uniref:N-acetylmuramoyl-L-alanine amidase n=1 Tax=Hyphomicrobium sp. TaxID=82 RepID=UPI0025BD1301|nr:N-acetylmuramoyl-L-alanine amidase [Hyphomicrobium sp.]MCC7253436.1 N-acetylmuramoyl-L-alanine amidase [Hyphomicrobium sp.]